MNRIINILLNRNTILVLSVIVGLIWGDYAVHLKAYTFYALALVMTFATTGIQTKSLWPLSKIIKPILMGAFLNYVLFAFILISLAWLLMPDKILFYGFVVIAAAPPGVAVIPFSHILKGDVNYAILGTLGAFIASIFVAPILVRLFADSDGVDPMHLFKMMLSLVFIPLLISRLLLVKPIVKTVQKIRGKVVDWGFAIIIFTAVGINRKVFFSDFDVLWRVSLVLFVSIFVLGWAFEKVSLKLYGSRPLNITQNLLVTIKSSGFSVVTAMTLFGEQAAIPSAILAVFVLSYLLYLSFRLEFKKSN